MPVLHFDNYYGPPSHQKSTGLGPGNSLSQASSAAKLPVKRMNKTDRKVAKGRMTASNATMVPGREFLPHIKEFKRNGSRSSMKKTASKSPRSVPFEEPQIEVVPEEQNITESEDMFGN